MREFIPYISLALSFISCTTFCYACYLQYKTIQMMKKDKKANKLRQMLDTKMVKELSRKDKERDDQIDTEDKEQYTIPPLP